MKKKALRIILLVLSILCFLAAAALLIIKLFPEKQDFDKYKNTSSDVSSTLSEVLPDNPINFDELKAQNPDVCGYIKVDGLDIIDYPIMHSDPSYKNESFYLNHDWLKNSKGAGSIYIQNYNSIDFSDFCTVIYGHDMLNGTMFGLLKKFRNADFFNQNRNITIYTPGSIKRYEIVSAFVYDDRHILNSYDFSYIENRQKFISDVITPKSLAKNVLEGASIDIQDKLVVLSTCTNNDNERYLVVGKLVETTKTK